MEPHHIPALTAAQVDLIGPLKKNFKKHKIYHTELIKV